MALAPNGRWSALGTLDGKLYLLDLEAKKVFQKFEDPNGLISSLAYSSDGLGRGSRQRIGAVPGPYAYRRQRGLLKGWPPAVLRQSGSNAASLEPQQTQRSLSQPLAALVEEQASREDS
jgi:hypothetical protein